MEHLASSSSPSCSSQAQNTADRTPGRVYDVFLNHRGPDVKDSLASIIYHWLEDKGLRVFFDKEEFEAGEELHPTIQGAIGSAWVHVAIFSKGYAESSWCLEELCSMLKSGAKIIPLFYDVLPSDLRWVGEGKGLYVSAFAQHQMKQRVDLQKMHQWKEALRKISYMNGLELNGSKFKGDQGMLLKTLVDDVSKEVAKKVPLEPANDPVGLDEAVEDFEHFLEAEAQPSGEERVKIVGIVGFGGFGKTTLAKHFYNIRRPSFTASSFLSEVRHAAAQQKLQSLQSKILKDLLNISDSGIENSSVSDGRGILKNKFSRSSTPRVLVVLDDIDHENQMEDLLVKEFLGSGSLILLTSRDGDALRKSGVRLPYKIKPLKTNHALELFCRHAFQQPRPKRGFEDLAEKFCEKCGGFPLFLKVMGAHLRVTGGDDKDVWHAELEYIPNDIENLLKISYDALSTEEKQMLLDIACFFLREDKTSALRVWNVSYGRAFIRLQALERKCLVEVDHCNRLKLHDHLRDFGREIAEQESPCRFWNPREIINISNQLQGRQNVWGIIASHLEYSKWNFEMMMAQHGHREYSLWQAGHDLRLNSIFEQINLQRLRFLAIEGDCLENRLERQATDLMWFRWYDCPHTTIPSWWISMKYLTVLHILGGKLKKWEPRGAQLPSLKELVIQDTPVVSVSIDGDACSQLEHLDLTYNPSLIKVEHLPTTLALLHFSGCPSLTEISASFHLKKLKHLFIMRCHELKELPDLKHLTSLETLRVQICSKLQNIQRLEHLAKLRELDIGELCELGELPNLSGLTSLETLRASNCRRLQNIQGLEHLANLRKLDVRGCSQLGELPNLSGLTSLETLRASNCSKLQNVQRLEHLAKLRELDIGECSELGELPNLSGVTSLETLRAPNCRKLQNIQGLEHLANLRKLDIRGCSQLGELPNLSSLTSLETLWASNCSELQNVQRLEHLAKLRELDIGECSELGELPNLSGLTSLETLRASNCHKLQNIRGLEHLANLRKLDVRGCSQLGELPNLSSLTSLETLWASNCSKLQNVQRLEHLAKLRELDIGRCSELGELPNLSSLTSLETLRASNCHKLQNIQGLEHLAKLRVLDVSRCCELGELPNLSGLTSLETLQVKGCSKLQNIQDLEHLSKRRRLAIGRWLS